MKAITQWLKNNRTAALLALAALCAALALGLFWLRAARANRAAYTAAEQLIAQGEYAQAKDQLAPLALKDYRAAFVLRSYCLARLAYGRAGGDLQSVRDALSSLPSSQTEDLSAAQKAEIEAFRQEMEQERDRLIKEAEWQQRVAEQEEAERRQLEQLRSGPPYKGMAEKWIGDTALGSPSPEVRRQYIWYNDSSRMANLYDFTDPDGTLLYTVGCVGGRVVRIWDKRPVGYAPSPTPKPTPKPDSDPYRAGEFSDPESFYDEYWDEFDNYYDAEYYWETHH